MKLIRILKASKDWKVLRRHHDTEDGEEYYYIEGPKGIYQDEDGNTYKFNTKEEAEEELGYLKSEHKYEKKSALNENCESIRYDFLNGIIDEETAIDSLIDIGEFTEEEREDARIAVHSWSIEDIENDLPEDFSK